MSESGIYDEAGDRDNSDPDSNESSDHSDAGNQCNSDGNDEKSEDSTSDSADDAPSMEKSTFKTAWTCSLQTPFETLDRTAPSHTEMKRVFREIFLPHTPPELVHMIVLYKIDRTEVHFKVETQLRIYIQSKPTSSRTWSTWLASGESGSDTFRKAQWTAINGGLASDPAYARDMESVADPANPWKILMVHGVRREPMVRRKTWSFCGVITVDFSESACAGLFSNENNCDDNKVDLARMVQLCSSHFSRSYLPEGKLPSGVKHAWVLCKFDRAVWQRESGRQLHEASFNVRGFVQTKSSTAARWKKWLPPPEFRWKSILGGLHGNKDFDTAKRELSDPNSNYPWLELLSDGALRRNNRGRNLQAKQKVSESNPLPRSQCNLAEVSFFDYY